MSYDLKPRNKELDWLSGGIFSWPWMLDYGLGLVIGYGKGIKPGSYIYQIYKNRKGSPCSNDGFYITSKEAKIMALLARGIVSVEKYRTESFDALPEEERKQMEEWNQKHDRMYNLPIRSDFIDKAEKFADWAEKSGGFWIR